MRYSTLPLLLHPPGNPPLCLTFVLFHMVKIGKNNRFSIIMHEKKYLGVHSLALPVFQTIWDWLQYYKRSLASFCLEVQSRCFNHKLSMKPCQLRGRVTTTLELCQWICVNITIVTVMVAGGSGPWTPTGQLCPYLRYLHTETTEVTTLLQANAVTTTINNINNQETIMVKCHCESSPGSCDECRLSIIPQTQSINLGCESAGRLLPSTSTIAIHYYSA